ncbi:MAG: hypothetical protein ACRD29_14675 [Acidimicrobiales bacterium]
MSLSRLCMMLGVALLVFYEAPVPSTAAAQSCPTGGGDFRDEIEVFADGDCDNAPSRGQETPSPEWRKA